MGGVAKAVGSVATSIAQPVEHAVASIPVIGKPAADLAKVSAGAVTGNIGEVKAGATSLMGDANAVTGSSANTALVGNVAGAAFGDPLAGSQATNLLGTGPATGPTVTSYRPQVTSFVPVPTGGSSNNTLLLIGGGVAVLVVVYLITRRKK